VAAVLALVSVLIASARAQEVIERVLAVVDGQVVTLSDVRGALALGLVPDPPQGADPVGAVLIRLIDRELMLREVQRYLPLDPARTDVEQRLGRIRSRFPSEPAFQAALAQTGFDEERLRDWVRNDLRIDEYLRDRFVSAGQLSDEEVEVYLKQHQTELTREGLSPNEMRDLARASLAEERRAGLIDEWLDGLRRRAEVVNLYLLNPG
jgi:peptidyl-prolyl cis-trans isomerase SurA